MSVSDSGIRGAREFAATSWSTIVKARDPQSPEYAHHLARFVELYWRPVYAVIRRGWSRSHDDAKDLTQEFFATVIFDRALLERSAPELGSFRTLLRVAITRFMQDVARGANRHKRAAEARALPLDDFADDGGVPSPDDGAVTPDVIFDRAWNEAVMSQAIARLEQHLKAEGQGQSFEVFRRYDLEGDSAALSYAALGQELSLSAGQVKYALLQAREAFRRIVTDVVRGYLDDPEDAAAVARELRDLFGA
jgi:RNA polymerase sigma factor (sigma-70 family)